MDWEPNVGDAVHVPARTVRYGTIVGINSDDAGLVYLVKPVAQAFGSGEPSWRGTTVVCGRDELRPVS
jgi:hypothetical protein